MSYRKVARLKLDPLVTERLIKNNILTAHDLLECPVLSLMEIVDQSYADVVSLISSVGAILVQSQTALEMLQSSFVPSGVFGQFTELMSGGFVSGTINEICGPPGIGKTQLCLGCCAEVLMAGKFRREDESNELSGAYAQSKRGGSIVYYDTELKFSAQRLLEILIARYPETALPNPSSPAQGSVAEDLLLRVSVRRPTTCKDLSADLQLLETCLVSEGVSLIVIDSIAALPRTEGVSKREEENFALQQASILQCLAESCSCAVLVTNQILPVAQRDMHNNMLGHVIEDASGYVKPALGIAWHHRIASRIVLSRRTIRRQQDAPHNSYISNREKYLPEHEERTISQVKSPLAPNFSLEYVISPRGIEVGVNDVDSNGFA